MKSSAFSTQHDWNHPHPDLARASALSLWRADIAGNPDPLLPLLTEDEAAAARGFSAAARRAEYVTGRALLRVAVACAGYEVLATRPLAKGAHGKPEFEAVPGGEAAATPPGPWFSLSHAAGQVVLALSRTGTVGADVESRQRTLPGRRLAARYCHTAELEHLEGTDDIAHQRLFVELWARKEAVLKARGDGVQGGPRHVDSVSEPGFALYHAPGGALQRWRLFDVPMPEPWTVAVAAVPESDPPVLFDADMLLRGPVQLGQSNGSRRR